VEATVLNHSVIIFFLLFTTATCLGISATHHTLANHWFISHTWWFRLDSVGMLGDSLSAFVWPSLAKKLTYSRCKASRGLAEGKATEDYHNLLEGLLLVLGAISHTVCSAPPFTVSAELFDVETSSEFTPKKALAISRLEFSSREAFQE
jgi:hypothetical protein